MEKRIQMSEAYQNGCEDFEAGYTRKNNPYPDGSIDFNAWHMGFEFAQDESSQRLNNTNKYGIDC